MIILRQDVYKRQNEQFLGSFNIGGIISMDNNFNSNYIEQYDENSLVKGFVIYDLLPEGMRLISTKRCV